MSISLPCPRSTRSSTPANADGGFVMLTAPLLQHFQIEITYGGAVSGPLTVPFSNRGRSRAGARTLTAGDIEMGTVIRFRPMGRPARGLGRSERGPNLPQSLFF